MFVKAEVFFLRLRRFFSRTEWAIRLLRLPKHKDVWNHQGLVMVQIDGLSLTQFHRGLQKGNLPFLKRLIDKERYAVHSHYSGLPSNTPAVQGELFYGVKTCVPAFSYVNRKSGNVVRMYDSHASSEVEARLKNEGVPLLRGGSSYSNIFTGGADEAHFCAAKMGWGGFMHAFNPLVLPVLVLLYLDIFVRTAVLLVVEFFMALAESVRGTLKGHLFLKEFEFILTRVFACILLRELVVVGASMDIARGLPVVHVNFIGYDEQAHRRGPSSAFAHWSLRGIDDGIRRIWNAARRSDRRPYETWVYSDHGQEKVLSYARKEGQSLEKTVEKIFGEAITSPDFKAGFRRRASDWSPNLFAEKEEFQKAIDAAGLLKEGAKSKLIVTAMGPIGHIYAGRPLENGFAEALAEKLAGEGGVPLVLLPSRDGKTCAWTKEGRIHLPEESERIFGKDHPFLEEASEDLFRILSHPDAGDFILMGWVSGSPALSFPLESGAHAGAGAEETSGFAFLPSDAPLEPAKPYLRPLDLRKAALKILSKEQSSPAWAAEVTPKVFRVMTYNVHGCLGMDGRLSHDRIARVIARHNVDAVALQELDVGRARSGGVDQAERIARKLEMSFHFHPAFRLKDEQYGNAILSRYPMALMKNGPLPRLYERRSTEPRGAIWVEIAAGTPKIQLINTHLSLWPHERHLQAKALVGPEWLGHSDCKGPVILCGDMNALPDSIAYRRFCGPLRDCQKILTGHKPFSTWSGRYPVRRIDHMFCSGELEVKRILVPGTSLDKVASDHLPLLTEFDLSAVEAPPVSTKGLQCA